jgi:hypothetical protein
MEMSSTPLRVGGAVSQAALLVVALLASWDARRRRGGVTA